MPTDKTTEPDSVLSFRGSMWDCLPRMLWQRLFNFYRSQNCPLDHMDNILIDFKNCQEVFANMNLDTVRFLWGCCPGHYSTTWLPEKSWWDGNPELTANGMSWDFVVLCEVNDHEARFTRVGNT